MELANPKTREKIHLKIAQFLMNGKVGGGKGGNI
jgi:hypothetical protein